MAALVEDLERARMEAAGARAHQVLAGAPLDNGDIDAGQRQLARQHQARRSAAGDDHRVIGHCCTPQARFGRQSLTGTAGS
jgi:hypothetical protein